MKSFIKGATKSALAAAMELANTGAQAVPLFSIDRSTNELVRIKSSAGAVSVVGALGIVAFNEDLARATDERT